MFTEGTKIEKLVEVMEAVPELDVVRIKRLTSEGSAYVVIFVFIVISVVGCAQIFSVLSGVLSALTEVLQSQ